MFTRKQLRGLGLLLTLVMMLTLVIGATKAQDKPKIIVSGRNMGSGDVATLDPAKATDSISIQFIDEMFLGLTMVNQDKLDTVPGIAESWTLSDDKLTTTFKIKKDVPWVHFNKDSGKVEEVKDDKGNVRMVTANDFVYGITRELSAENAGDYAFVLAPWVVNGVEFGQGKAKAEDLGIKAIDANTLEIKAPKYAAVSISIYGLWMSRATPQWAIDEAGDKWTEPENIATYGPFALKEWKHEQGLTLIKNPFWPGSEYHPQSKIDEVVFKFLDGPEQLKEYEAGTMDLADPPPEQLDRIRADATLKDQLYIGPRQCTYYVGIHVTDEAAPFNNAHIRRAFSYAIDRQAIIDNILKAGQRPAGYFSYPELAASPQQKDFPGTGIETDAAKAKSEFEAGLKELGMTVDQLPPITYLYNTSSAHKAIAEAMQQMWKKTLGVDVQLTAQDFNVYLQTRKNANPQLYRAAWCSDYPDAHNFLNDVFHSGSGNNDTLWTSAEFDKLVEDGVAVSDPQKRAEIYAKAEDILVNKDAVIAPIYFYTTAQMQKPYVTRKFSNIGTERYETWDINK
jgi:oligopeptide transport system substrate-binding protein